ncbi:hypothetical protein [Pseudomonas fluvialis]|uniref:hypothetical protein n=1 Tax=Pseudomonas fluvialis TaxID=1793966 RepID=UPI0035AE8686
MRTHPAPVQEQLLTVEFAGRTIRDARALAKRQGFSESPTFFRQEGRLAVLSYQRWEQVA